MKPLKIGGLLGNEEDIRAYEQDSLVVGGASYFVGLELELEEAPVDLDQLPHWSMVNDGSLRGENSIELISKYPYKGKDITESLQEVEKFFVKKKITPSCSSRTSVHVHIDVRDSSPQQYINLLVLYAIVEDLLFTYCGCNRKTNIYCIPWSETEAQLETCSDLFSYLYGMKDSSSKSVELAKKSIFKINQDTRKYSALNLAATAKHGSVEFRMHAGEWRAAPILEWVNILLSIKKYSMEFQGEPKDIINRLSIIGPAAFLKEVFAEHYIVLANDGYESDMFNGARIAQEILTGATSSEVFYKEFMDMAAPSIHSTPLMMYAKKRHLLDCLDDGQNEVYTSMYEKIHGVKISDKKSPLGAIMIDPGLNWDAAIMEANHSFWDVEADPAVLDEEDEFNEEDDD